MNQEEKNLRIFCAALNGTMTQLGTIQVQSVEHAVALAREAVRESYNNNGKATTPILS